MNIPISSLEDFKYNIERYIYDLEPEQDNLFIVTMFSDPKGGDGQFDNENWIQYQIKGVSFEGDNLSFDENYTTNFFRTSLVENLNFTKSVTIDWVEDVNRRVYEYHRGWLNCWYSRDSDFIPTGVIGKFRNMRVDVFHYVNINTESFSPVLTPVKIGEIVINGLIPEKVPQMKMSFDTPNNEGNCSITYRCSQAHFTPYNINGEGVGD